MSTFVIGDVHGCFRTLRALLDRCRFDARHDRLWFVGDLVNRGPDSLGVLRFVRDLGEGAVTLLGNHDLHFLAAAHGLRESRPNDRLSTLLKSPDRADLVKWMLHRLLFHREGNRFMVHAGLLPQWSLEDAQRLAGEAETALRHDPQAVLAGLNGPAVDVWDDGLSGAARVNAILQALTRLRTCTPEGRMCLKFTGPPQEAPQGCHPWFALRRQRFEGCQVYCGHWAALGLHRAGDVLALDSGCVWGGRLTAVRAEDGQVFQQPCLKLEPAR